MILNECYFKMSNSIFSYELTPIQYAVYSYLVSLAGQKEKCWPSMRRIAACCHCSKNATRAAVDELERRGFIRKVHSYKENKYGSNRQTNNLYYILDMPALYPPLQPMHHERPSDGGEMNNQDSATKL